MIVTGKYLRVSFMNSFSILVLTFLLSRVLNHIIFLR